MSEEKCVTCPASRHAAMIADDLRNKRRPLHKLLAGHEPAHMGESIQSAVDSLWHARQFLKWESLPPTKKYKVNGHWVLDMDHPLIATALADARERAVEDERARIVAWLRNDAVPGYTMDLHDANDLAAAIERGEHIAAMRSQM